MTPCNDCIKAGILTKAKWSGFVDGKANHKSYCDDCRKFTEKLNRIQPFSIHIAKPLQTITFQPL